MDLTRANHIVSEMVQHFRRNEDSVFVLEGGVLFAPLSECVMNVFLEEYRMYSSQNLNGQRSTHIEEEFPRGKLPFLQVR